MPKAIAEYNKPSELDQIMKNAKRAGRMDVYWQAFKRRCELEGIDQDDPLHRDFYQTLHAYEELLSEKNGRTTKASRTRQKLARHGVERCLEDWATDSKETAGFTLLVANNLVQLTGEFLVMKHSARFSERAIQSAQKRLREIEVRAEIAAAFQAAGIRIGS